jgi:hypothetical protein
VKNLNAKFLVIGFFVFVVGAFMPAHAFADADVDVYAEGAYDDTYLDVYIYADCNVAAVISYGVRLGYDPLELTVYSSAKNVSPTPYTTNETLWELGSGVNKDNPDPVDTGTAVIFKGGILDEAAPTDGVTDIARVFLGMVSFTATGGGPPPSSPALTLTYAEDYSADPDSYKNFVRYNAAPPASGVVIDSADSTGVDFTGVTIRMRGDANGDGDINGADYVAIRNNLGSEDFPPWVDCNGDGSINGADYVCVRNKL